MKQLPGISLEGHILVNTVLEIESMAEVVDSLKALREMGIREQNHGALTYTIQSIHKFIRETINFLQDEQEKLMAYDADVYRAAVRIFYDFAFEALKTVNDVLEDMQPEE